MNEQYIETKWNETENAKDYEVFTAIKPLDPNADPDFRRKAKTDHLFYFIQGAVAGATYLIKVRGVTHFRKGEFSDVVEVEIV